MWRCGRPRDFLREQFRLSTKDAYVLASTAVDFRVAEAVDSVQMIYGMIPKKVFKQTPQFWSKRWNVFIAGALQPQAIATAAEDMIRRFGVFAEFERAIVQE